LPPPRQALRNCTFNWGVARRNSASPASVHRPVVHRLPAGLARVSVRSAGAACVQGVQCSARCARASSPHPRVLA
jgi:hypothetical protein